MGKPRSWNEAIDQIAKELVAKLPAPADVILVRHGAMMRQWLIESAETDDKEMMQEFVDRVLTRAKSLANAPAQTNPTMGPRLDDEDLSDALSENIDTQSTMMIWLHPSTVGMVADELLAHGHTFRTIGLSYDRMMTSVEECFPGPPDKEEFAAAVLRDAYIKSATAAVQRAEASSPIPTDPIPNVVLLKTRRSTNITSVKVAVEMAMIALIDWGRRVRQIGLGECTYGSDDAVDVYPPEPCIVFLGEQILISEIFHKAAIVTGKAPPVTLGVLELLLEEPLDGDDYDYVLEMCLDLIDWVKESRRKIPLAPSRYTRDGLNRRRLFEKV